MSEDLEQIARTLRYDGWANAQALASVRQESAPPRALRWMAHIAGAEILWLCRLRQEPSTVPVWPDPDLEICAARLAELAIAWPAYLGELEPDGLEDGVGYRNSKGEFWTSSVRDILTHVTLHSAYHRGQIAAAIREAGGNPASTDFIHAVRQRSIE